MQLFNLKNFTGGWFIGNFIPSLFPLDAAEVCIKRYVKGTIDNRHLHKIADEITVIVSGKVKMNGTEYVEDDVILIKSGEATDFIALTDSITCVVKIPSIKEDKYIV